MPARVVINRSAIAGLTGPGGPIVRGVARRSERVVNRAKMLVRVDTGRLRSSITFVIIVTPAAIEARIGTNVSYGAFQERGTGLYGPHHTRIVSPTGKVMVWIGSTTYSGKGVAGAGPRGGSRTNASAIYAMSTRGQPGTHYLALALPAALT